VWECRVSVYAVPPTAWQTCVSVCAAFGVNATNYYLVVLALLVF